MPTLLELLENILGTSLLFQREFILGGGAGWLVLFHVVGMQSEQNRWCLMKTTFPYITAQLPLPYDYYPAVVLRSEWASS